VEEVSWGTDWRSELGSRVVAFRFRVEVTAGGGGWGGAGEELWEAVLSLADERGTLGDMRKGYCCKVELLAMVGKAKS